MKSKIKAPIECRTFDDICNMPRDNVYCGDFSILIDECTVYLDEQKLGEPPKQQIAIPKSVFKKFITWYTTGKKR